MIDDHAVTRQDEIKFGVIQLKLNNFMHVFDNNCCSWTHFLAGSYTTGFPGFQF